VVLTTVVVVSYGKRISSVMAELDFAKYGSIVTDIKQQQTKMLDFSKFGSIVTTPFRKKDQSLTRTIRC
jgi:hypothetical protein